MPFKDFEDSIEQSKFGQLIDMLKSENYNERWYAAEALGRFGDLNAIEPLIDSLDAEVSYVASAETLVKFGDPALLILIRKLKETGKNKSIIVTIINVLELMQDERAIEPLIVIAKDINSDFRNKAIFALNRINGSQVIDLFVDFVRSDPNWIVRREAAIKLGEIRDFRAVEPLISMLEEKDERLNWLAASSLGKIKDFRAVEPLIQALNKESNKLRQYSAQALGSLVDARAVAALTHALKDDYSGVREEAASALARIRDIKAVEPLIQALKDKNPQVKGYIIEALGVIGDVRALPALKELAQKSSGIEKTVLGTPLKEVAAIAILRIKQRQNGFLEPFEFVIR